MTDNPELLALAWPPEPKGTEEVWYRGWECGYDDMAAKYVPDCWIGYKGGCDLDAPLDAPKVSAKTWTDLLAEIDAEEGPIATQGGE